MNGNIHRTIMPLESQTPFPVISSLPDVTFRQLEVFSLVCREASFTNAALEARSTRANIKRICKSLEQAIGRPLLDESSDGPLIPNAFGRELLEQARPLARGLRRLGDSIRSEHDSGRIVRFAAAPAFFQGGAFTEFVKRFGASSRFRPCFLRIEENRFQNALLNAECDVYLGTNLESSSRFDSIDIGPVGTKKRKSGIHFTAVLRKHHPYAELMPQLVEAARL